MNKLQLAGAVSSVALATAFSGGHASAALCPAIGVNAAGCGEVITFNANGSISTHTNTSTPYDNVEDTSVGVINNTGSAISSFTLTSSTQTIFGFDGDGIDGFQGDGVTKAAGNPDTTGYGGPHGFFTGIAANQMSGTVNFSVPIAANGGTDFFSLEEPVDLTKLAVNVPEPASLAIFGSALFGIGLMRRRRKGA
jgi:hypothetical protein